VKKMLDEIEGNEENDTEVPREKIKLQFHWYLSMFFVIYYLSYVVSGIIFMTYIIIIFIPHVLLVDNLITIFTNFDSLIAFLALPLVIIVSYLSRLFIVGLISRIFWRFTEYRSPTKDGVIPRNIGSKTANYYHIRSFMLKYGKNSFMKGVFPWLANWFFNFVGTGVIKKGSTLEESVVTDKNINVGRNCYIGVNSALSSHFVEGIFGNIVFFEIKLGDNVTLGGFNNIAPGCELSDNSYLLPIAAATKHNKTKGDNYYFGMPFRRIFKKKIMDYLKVSEEDLERAEKLRVKQENEKLKRQKKVTNDENS
jgi:acetyltransferase-like isoleucine patch superfamily enzyme